MNSTDFQPVYSPWRHGGWYVDNVRYPSGATGCVSRNYPDRKWRIVCDERPDAHELYTYPSRDAAARAEYELAQEATQANADAALKELRRLRGMGALGYAANAFGHLDRMLSAGGPLPAAWQHRRTVAEPDAAQVARYIKRHGVPTRPGGFPAGSGAS